jgi:hypothetical protein
MKHKNHLLLLSVLALTTLTAGLEGQPTLDKDEDASELKGMLSEYEAEAQARAHLAAMDHARATVNHAVTEFKKKRSITTEKRNVFTSDELLVLHGYDLNTMEPSDFSKFIEIIKANKISRLQLDGHMFPTEAPHPSLQIHNCILPTEGERKNELFQSLSKSPITSLSLSRSQLDPNSFITLLKNIAENQSNIATVHAILAVAPEMKGRSSEELIGILQGLRNTLIARLILNENEVADFVKKENIPSLVELLSEKASALSKRNIAAGETLDHLYKNQSYMVIEFKNEHWYISNIEMHEQPLILRARIVTPKAASDTYVNVDVDEILEPNPNLYGRPAMYRDLFDVRDQLDEEYAREQENQIDLVDAAQEATPARRGNLF